MLMQLLQYFLNRIYNLESDESKNFSIFPIVKILC